MNFMALDKICLVKKKGFWRPFFKKRIGGSYFNHNERNEYENNLRNRLFDNNTNNIIISENSYPFNFGENVEQYVIWIRDINEDPGIEKISELIKNKYPNKDYLVSHVHI